LTGIGFGAYLGGSYSSYRILVDPIVPTGSWWILVDPIVPTGSYEILEDPLVPVGF
jgi:hypothetical protein